MRQENALMDIVLKNREKKTSCKKTWDRVQAANGVSLLSRPSRYALQHSTPKLATALVGDFPAPAENLPEPGYVVNSSLFLCRDDTTDDTLILTGSVEMMKTFWSPSSAKPLM
jgi:hypothetical protein